MLRTTISKIKKVCTNAAVPRILQGELKYAQKKFSKHSMLSRAAKSTSANDAGGKDDKTEPDKSSSDTLEKTLEKPDENIIKTVAQTEEEKINELCLRIINKNANLKPLQEGAIVNATPNKGENVLEQKIEKIEESPLVETSHKYEEQIAPKVLESQQVLEFSEESDVQSGTCYDSSYDELATKCLSVPPDEVDDFILKELRKYNEDIVGNVYENKPVEWYYSDAIYTPQQIIPLGNATSVPGEKVTEDAEKKEEVKDAKIMDVYKSETIHPRPVDEVSIYGEETNISDCFLDRPDFETPLIINPYDNNLIFPLDTYMLRDDDVPVEPPTVQESLAPPEVVTKNDFGNNDVMPPPEMEIEIDRPGISKQLQGSVAGISLVPEDITAPESTSTSNIQMSSFKDSGYNMYSRTQYPTGPPYGYWPTQIGQHNQRQPVVPNTSISGKSPKKQGIKSTDTSISSQQRLHDMYMAEIKLQQEMQELETSPTYNQSSQSYSHTDSSYSQIAPSYSQTAPSYVQTSPSHSHTSPPCNQFVLSKQSDMNDKQPNIKDTIHPMPNCFVKKDPISHIIFEPEPKPEECKPKETASKAEQAQITNQIKDAQQTLNSNLTATTGPVPSVTEETEELPLKEMLRRIRERHRQEQCQKFFNENAQVHMSTSCQPVKMPFPPPCKPRPKEEKSESPSKCPSPKKDPPKNPCAKFSEIPSDIINAICLVRLSQSSDFGNAHDVFDLNYQSRNQYSHATSLPHLHSLDNALERELYDEDVGFECIGDLILARDYEPWTPIPSWPIPEKEKRRKLVTPKEGCKLLPPPRLHPSQKDKPCVSFPKKTFSLAELLEHQPVGNVHFQY